MLPKPVVGWHCDFAFQHAPIGIALVDINGHILRGNDAFAAMIGLPLVQAEGLHFRAFTHPDDLSADLDLFNGSWRGSVMATPSKNAICAVGTWLLHPGN